MPEIIVRVGVLVLVSLLAWLLTWSGRRFVEIRRQQALAAAPLSELTGVSDESADSNQALVRILAFSSPDCRQCHQLQAPALQRIQEIHGTNVSVVEVDAPDSSELTERYRVLTVPTTVVLDASGHAYAVNYGFANTRRLLDQVDAVLAQVIQPVS